MSKLSICFADLFHKKNFAGNVVPLNLGYLANALNVTFGNAVDIQLFKYVDELIRILDAKRPDVVCFTNFLWNQRLSLWCARYIKKLYPATLIVMGGPSVRPDLQGLKTFLERNPEIDVYIPLNGELPIVDLVRALLKHGCGEPVQAAFAKIGNLPGVYANTPGYAYVPYDLLSFKNSFQFGSPYLNGVLDKFIADKGLSPIFETNRGCPYGCSYCSWGIAALSRVYQREMNIVLKEFDYVAQHGAGQKNWVTADANFGMFPRDVEIAKTLKSIREKYGYPVQVDVNWAKSSSADRVIELTRILGDMISPQIAVQSLDPYVLKNSNRVNLKEADIVRLIDIFHQENLGVHTDILVGLGGESAQSNKNSLQHSYELGFDHPGVRSVILLPGTENESDESRNKYGFIGKYRKVSDSYGEYLGEFVFEVEETVVGSKDLSESEFWDLREIHFLNYALWCSGLARGLLKLGMNLGVPALDVMEHLQKKSSNESLRMLLADLRRDLQAEQFDKLEDLEFHMNQSQTKELLLKGGAQDKLMWKYLARFLVESKLADEMLEEVAQFILSRISMTGNVLELAKRISIDSRVHFEGGENLNKVVKYAAPANDYEFLKKSGFLPAGLNIQHGILRVTYEYSKDLHDYFRGLMAKFNYSNNPIAALYATLHYNLAEHLSYSVSFDFANSKSCIKGVIL